MTAPGRAAGRPAAAARRGGGAAKPPGAASRRSPRQDRARTTVDAILAGAARVLAEVGFEAINTNSVAAAAGVSIGSLYQYFANKDEIVVMLIDRHCGMMTAIVTSGLAEHAGAPLPVMVRGLIRTVLEAQQTERGFFRVLREQVPRSSRFCRLHEVLDQVTLLVGMAFAARQAELKVRSPASAAFLVVHAVDGIIDAALRQGFSAAAYDALVGDVGDLVLLYLSGIHPAVPHRAE